MMRRFNSSFNGTYLLTLRLLKSKRWPCSQSKGCLCILTSSSTGIHLDGWTYPPIVGEQRRDVHYPDTAHRFESSREELEKKYPKETAELLRGSCQVARGDPRKPFGGEPELESGVRFRPSALLSER